MSNNHVINPSVYKKMPFDSLADITPIMVVGTTPLVLVVNPTKMPVKDAKEFIAALKAKPNGYNYASSGNGTILHLAAEMFLDQTGTTSAHVPYKGVGAMVTDLLGGQVDWGVLALPSVQQHLKSGALRAIGTGTSARIAAAPDIPDHGGARRPGLSRRRLVRGHRPGQAAPGAGEANARRMDRRARHAEVQEAMAKQGNVIKPTTPEAAVAFFKSEQDKYAKLVQKAGVKLD